MGILLSMQTNPDVYSSNDVLQNKTSPMPVFKPYKDLTLNRALSFILQFLVYTKKKSLQDNVTVVNTNCLSCLLEVDFDKTTL